MLGNCEENTSLSRALSKLAEVEDRVDQIHQEQANQDFYVFAELLKDYISLITAIKVIIVSRYCYSLTKFALVCYPFIETVHRLFFLGYFSPTRESLSDLAARSSDFK